MEITVYLLSAFGTTPKGGNPAGVVLDGDALSDAQMQQIATQVGFSETAFVHKSTKATFSIRFFTPNAEVDLCGHATIAAFFLLFAQNKLLHGTYTQEIKAGVLPVQIFKDGTIYMDQKLPEFGAVIPENTAATILNIPVEHIQNTGLKPQIVSTGLADILVPIDTREHLFQIKLDAAKMKDFNQSTKTVGFHAFTFDTLEPTSTAHCRNFAPLYDILEEAATGSSNGALNCYLYRYQQLKDPLAESVFEQGYAMEKPSHISSRLIFANNEISRVLVGGQALEIGAKKITI